MSNDEAAVAELEKRSLMTTPVILIGDQVVVGFDKARLAKLLGF